MERLKRANEGVVLWNLKIGVLISGWRHKLQAIIDNINNGNINGKIELIISNKEDAYGLSKRSKKKILKPYT